MNDVQSVSGAGKNSGGYNQTKEMLLAEKEQEIKEVNGRIGDTSETMRSLDLSSKQIQTELKESERSKQALENVRLHYSHQDGAVLSRDAYVSQLMENEETRKAVEGEIRGLANNVKELTERESTAHKRLAIVRLMSMLDDLQSALQKKIEESNDDEETRAQELLKAIQELSRDRENNMLLLAKKEREMNAMVDLKKKRVADLKQESDQNVYLLRQSGDYQLLGVAQRIQHERLSLLNEIEKVRDTNEKLADVVHVTKLSDSSTIQKRGAALSADEAMVTSADPEEESRELRKRIEVANTERRRLEVRVRAINERMDEDTDRYTRKMTQMRKEVLFYQQECGKIERENKDLKYLCDSLAASLQS